MTGAHIALQIDGGAAEPVYQQVCDQLRDAISRGRLPAGMKLPSTRILSVEAGVSRNTLVRAFETLMIEGYLTGRVGSGTFVANLGREAPVAPPAGATAPSGGDYPFRSLSSRGKALVASAVGGVTERPIPFNPDLTDPREFPLRGWLRLLGETSGRLTREALAVPSNAGYEPLRRAIAETLSAARGMDCEPRQVVVTTGSQQSIDLVCRMLIDPGDPVWLEEPGYVGTRSLVAATGGRAVPVPVDRDGARIEAAVAANPAPRLVVTSPSRHYPLGATLSVARRRALAELARSVGCWVVEDDYDFEFRYSGSAPPSIYGMDASARTIYVGTFSKILMPSFRLGYLVLPQDLVEPFQKARSVVDRHASLIEQMVLAEFMQRGLLASHVRRMRGVARTRQRTLIAGLERMFGEAAAFSATETGTHLVLGLRDDADDRALANKAASLNVALRPLSPYYGFTQPRKGLLLGFAAFTPEEIERSLGRLAALRDDVAPLLRPPGATE